jgi:hypothetical protein
VSKGSGAPEVPSYPMSPEVINTVWGGLGEEDCVWLECTSYRLAGARGKKFADSMKQFISVSINTEYNSSEGSNSPTSVHKVQ